MKRVLCTAAVLLVSAAVAWTGGYDFDYRSAGVAVWAVVSLVLAALTYSHPGWTE